MKLSYKSLRQSIEMLLTTLLVLLLNLAERNTNHCFYHPNAHTNLSSLDLVSSLKTLNLNGQFDFENIHHVANDFGNIHHFLPIAVLTPKTVSDISTTIKHVFSHNPDLTITPRGHGHSFHGQSQGHGGLVISMESLEEPKIKVQTGEHPYVDVSGGELWINILHESLKHGLTPKSWTDYLYLTVGGTLSNAGFSGQAFRHGPQIHNVYQLEVVTGKGDIINCSEKQNSDLFYGVLGGLGQFGIITKARISLEPALKMVKWIRVLYSDFNIFIKDQEQLISSNNSFDYIEGFVIINRTGLVNSWRSNFIPKDPVQASQFISEGKTLYCLEMAKYYNPVDDNITNQKVESILSKLNYMPHTLFQSETSYTDFLNRLHLSEIKLREKGLWEVPHPWLNLLVPKSKIQSFAKVVFGQIITDTSNGPILMYPVNQSRWDAKTSMVTPAEDVFYLIAFLSSAVPSSTGSNGLENIITKNKQILSFCETAKLGVKQYLPNYDSQHKWQNHFGSRWDDFARRKLTYDPLSILTPGQRIFRKGSAIS